MSFIQSTKTYRSQAFVERIESSLANISSHPDDEFRLISAYYDAAEFNCELCGHTHCVYAFEVENLKTNKTLKVGSECVDHFKDKGIDIDLAEAMMKRVYKSTTKARNQIKKEMAEEAWKLLSDEEKRAIPYYKRNEYKEELGSAEMKKLSKDAKRDLLIEAYMVIQAKELLMDVAHNKHILTEEEIKNIIDMGLEEQLENSKRRAEQAAKYHRSIAIKTEVRKALEEAGNQGYIKLDPTWVKEKIKESEACNDSMINEVEHMISRYNVIRANMGAYKPILSYTGRNPIVLNIKDRLQTILSISPAQEEYALRLISQENNFEKDEMDPIVSELLLKEPTAFVKSVAAYYHKNGHMSSKQKTAMMRIYKKYQK